jgi:hypothetical protein
MGACLSDTSAVIAVSPKSVSTDASAEEAEAADIDRALLALERDQKELDYIGRLTNRTPSPPLSYFIYLR